MNAAARHLAQQQLWEGKLTVFVISPRMVGLLALVTLVLASAFGIIYERNQYRSLVSNLQGYQSQHYNLHVEAQQLLLEQTTWASQARIQHVAQHALHMVPPKSEQIVLVSE